MAALENFIHNLVLDSTVPVITALLLGIMSAIGPCTMTTNIAAMAYIGRRLDERRFAVLASLSYAAGRMLALTVLGAFIIGIGLEVPAISNFLQDIGTYVVGPLLVIAGLLMLVADRISFGKGGRIAALSAKISNKGILGAFLMGIFFALAFCPYSALLFFAVMIPLALTVKEGIVLPAAFALGSGLPVIIAGVLLSAGVATASKWAGNIAGVQKYIRIIIALIFIGVGIYLVLKYYTSIF
jgi:cytochrome c biogenesis protein CcdA